MFALFVWGWHNTDSLALVGGFPAVVWILLLRVGLWIFFCEWFCGFWVL